jgi:hypothetical protein
LQLYFVEHNFDSQKQGCPDENIEQRIEVQIYKVVPGHGNMIKPAINKQHHKRTQQGRQQKTD